MTKRFSPLTIVALPFLLMGILMIPASVSTVEASENSYLCSWDNDFGCGVDYSAVNCDSGYEAGNACLGIDSSDQCASVSQDCVEAPRSISLGLAERVATLYNWALGIGGVLALGVIIYGGLMYTASGGNASTIGEAKKWITSAIFGLILLLSSYLILNILNPSLTTLKEIVLGFNPRIEAPPIDVIGDSLEGNWCSILNGEANFVPGEQTCPFRVEPGFTNSWCQDRSLTKYHLGADMFPLYNNPPTPLYAIEDGVITESNCYRALTTSEQRIAGIKAYLWGRASSNSYYYAHMDSCIVRPGQEVQMGDLIGYVGRTGNAATTPPHLHIGVRKDAEVSNYLSGEYVDPYPLMASLCKSQGLPQTFCRESCDGPSWFCASFPYCGSGNIPEPVNPGGILACPRDDHSDFPNITDPEYSQHIEHLQRDLIYVTGETMEVNGKFDTRTKGAIRAYRDANNLSPVVIVDRVFWDLLEEDLNDKCPSQLPQ